MPDRPYQKKVDEFLAGYTDKFLPTLVTGKGAMAGPETEKPVGLAGKDLVQQNLYETLARSVHPDTMNRVMETMGGRGVGVGSLMAGQGTRESPFTNLIGPRQAIPSHNVPLGSPMSTFSSSPEGQRIMRERAIPIPGVSAGFRAPTGGGTLEELRAAIPPEFARGTTAPIEMAPNGEGIYEQAIPGGGDWRGDLAKTGTWSVGPERFFLGGKEVAEGTPGAVSGDELARQRITTENKPPETGFGGFMKGSALGGYYDAHPEERVRDQMMAELKPISDTYLGLIEKNKSILQGFGLPADQKTASAMQIQATKNIDELQKGLGIMPKMFEEFYKTQAEQPYKKAMADYYRTKGATETALGPAEFFERMARGQGYLAEAERPHAFPPNSAVYQGAKLLGYVPEKPEAIHPIIRDVINKSTMVDPNTGQSTGFDIRGARQKIGFMAPWLKAQGIQVPKESYKMTKPEFMAENKAWIEKLPKKERKKYTPQYTEQLWGEYWGKD